MTLALGDFRFGLIKDALTAEVMRDIALELARVNAGTVTSVALAVPTSIMGVSGSPGTGAASLAISLATQSANKVWAGPSSGGATVPTFRSLVVADLPASTGTVTSVALSLPAIFSVSGSPVTTAGTLTGALVTQTANTVFAGPASGGSTAPTFRTMVAADLPAGTGTVTSVALSLPAIFSVSGSPVTTTGTLAGALATQTANTVWAGPASGAASAPTFRSMVAADRFLVVATTTATPTTVASTTEVQLVNVSGAAAITLPSHVSGRKVTVKDISGAATLNNITVSPPSGNIDGAATYVILVNYQSVDFVSDGTNYWVT